MAEEPYLDPGPGPGPPDAMVLDIGGDVGALIITATEECLGREVDLTPSGAPRSHQVHTMICRRRLVNGEMFAGVYPELAAGRYTVWSLDDGGPLGCATVTGGAVAEFDGGDCRAPAPSPAD